MSQVRVISEYFIRPQFEVDESKRRYQLDAPGLSFLPSNYINSGHLFTKPHNYIPSSHLEKLKFSLYHALVHYYPLPGRLTTERYINKHPCCTYVDCRTGPGAKLIHASASDVTLSNIISPGSNAPDIFPSFFDLGEGTVNHDGHIQPLLSIQLTELVDGVVFGFSANHSLVDGTSFTHFQRVWSATFMRLSSFSLHLIRKPAFLDTYKRQVIKLPYLESSFSLPLIRKPAFLDTYKRQAIKLPYLESREFIIPSTIEGQVRKQFFHFSITTMGRLKAKALIAFVWKCITRVRNLPLDEVTTFALPVNLRPRFNPPLSQDYFGIYYTKSHGHAKAGELLMIAFVWKCITRVRNLPLDEVTTFALPVNLKPRFNPPLSQDYFGIYYTKSHGHAKVGELLMNSIGWAAMLLNRALASLDDKAVRGEFTRASVEGAQLSLQTPGLHSNHVIVAGSPRFDTDGPDFGLGGSVAHRGYGNKWDGKVNSYVGSQGKGSVELEICLAADTMNALSSDKEFMSFASQGHAGLNPVFRI